MIYDLKLQFIYWIKKNNSRYYFCIEKQDWVFQCVIWVLDLFWNNHGNCWAHFRPQNKKMSVEKKERTKKWTWGLLGNWISSFFIICL